MVEYIRKEWENNSLRVILVIAFILRLISVIFSKGYGMHDDHFLIIESSQSWVDGFDYNNWLPWNGTATPQGHSFFYIGIHYLIFLFFKFIGISDPNFKMFLIRLIHAVYSLLVVSLSYKITLRLSNKKNAKLVGLLLAILWMMPFFSVRNLVEMVAIPPLLASVWLIIKTDKPSLKQYLISGLIGGLAFSIRYQTGLFLGGMGLVLLYQKQFKQALVFGIAVIASISIFQGGIDFFIWHKPFTELTEYVRYNIENKNEYISMPWYNYILLLLGIFVPPYSILLFLGFFNTKKKYLLVFIPTLIFLVFHSYFPNKQERFIFSVLPFYIVLGIVGINNFIENKNNNKAIKAIYKYSFIFFLIINFILLTFVSTTYSKKARVETMYYLYKKQSKGNILYEGTNKGGSKILPQFYSGTWRHIFHIDNEENYHTYETMPDSVKPEFEYFIFYGNDNLENRKKRVENIFGKMQIRYKSAPSFVDWLLYTINPNNSNDTIFIYSPQHEKTIIKNK